MNRLRPILVCFVLALAAGEAFTAAEPAGGAQPRATQNRPVTLSARPDGGILVQAASYRALIGSDGNLHSLRTGDAELLDDRVATSLGSFFYVDHPHVLDGLTQRGAVLVDATDGTYSVHYRFRPREIRITLKNGGSRPVPYFVVLGKPVSVAANLSTGEAAAAPANEQWGDVRLATSSGAYLELVGGSRIWGPWLGRQVWEVSGIGPGQRKVVVLRPGIGEPPKPALEQLVGLHLDLGSDDGLVSAGDSVDLEVSIDNRSERPIKGLLSLELTGSRSQLAVYSTSRLDLPPKDVVRTRLQWRVSAPDFYTARATLATDRRDIAKARAAAGYRAPDIRAVVRKPDGFREFWDRFLAEMGDAPPHFRMVLDEQRSGRGVDVWVLQYRSLRGETVHGWYLVPHTPDRPPAILYLSGYGARPIDPPTSLAGRGYVVLAIDVRGNTVDRVRPRPFEDYATEGIQSPGSYVYRRIVGHAFRGLDFLRARSELDPDRIAVLGVSEGAGVALILAALRPDLKAVAADAPMLCDFPLSLRSAAWPYTEIARYIRERPQARTSVHTTLAYFDVANFAPDINCPVLVNIGFLDPVSLPAAVYGCANLVPGQKEILAFPEAGHEGGGEELWEYKLKWLAEALGP